MTRRHKNGNRPGYVNPVGGMRPPCAFDGCDERAERATITDRIGSRYVWVCEGHYPVWRQIVANQGARMTGMDTGHQMGAYCLASLSDGTSSGVPGRFPCCFTLASEKGDRPSHRLCLGLGGSGQAIARQEQEICSLEPRAMMRIPQHGPSSVIAHGHRVTRRNDSGSIFGGA